MVLISQPQFVFGKTPKTDSWKKMYNKLFKRSSRCRLEIYFLYHNVFPYAISVFFIKQI